jgi:hypothetical protein
VLVDKHLYGSHGDREWRCLDLAEGNQAWASDAVGVGSLVYADGRLYLYTEGKGEVAMIEASPKAFKVLGRFTVPKESMIRRQSGKHWTPPVIADGRLYLRDQELLFCFTIK